MTSLEKGVLLIAEPFLNDPNFDRSVILLCEYNKEGAFGLILNQPINILLSDVLDHTNNETIGLHIGGPVENDTLHYIHRKPDLIPSSTHIQGDIYWGGDFDVILELINEDLIKQEDILFYLGYSGWTKGQLEQEMETNTWIISPRSANFLFDTSSDQLWSKVLKSLGGKYKSIAHYPIDPRLN